MARSKELVGNKVAVVTGASRGIGKAIAIALSKEGYNLVLNYNSSQESIESYTKDLKTEIKLIQADVSQFDQAKTLIDEAFNTFGRLDVLVNNAGITKDNLLVRMSEEDFDQVIDVNLKGVFNCCQVASKRLMKQRQGKIINIASVSGMIGNAGQVNYSASKAGVIGMTKSMAKELAGRNITANVVAPGFIETDMTDALGDDFNEQVLSSIPMKRFGQPEEIANLVVFLSSESANYITGQVISVNGGMVM